MNDDKKIVRLAGGGLLMFFCPGCKCGHGVNDKWSFNGDMDRPTFSPSILVRGVQPVTDEEADRILAGEKIEPKPLVCHSFVRDGQIQFLNDCTHDLAGQTVPLEEF